jgi:hypothetical protein
MTPDLMMRIRGTFSRKKAKAIARESKHDPDVYELAAEGQGGMLRYQSWSLLIPAGHDLLTDDADWDAPTWAMDEAGLGRLVATMQWFYERFDGDFTFEAMWGTPKGEVAVSRQELLDTIRAGRIGNNVIYQVASQ